MPKQRFEQRKPHVRIGTIGHVDPNKETLIAALTKYLSEHGFNESYDVPEINGRGITINPQVIEEIQENEKVKSIGFKQKIDEYKKRKLK